MRFSVIGWWMSAVICVCAAGTFAIDLRRATRSEPAWFSTDEARNVIDSVISHQTQIGGWARGYDNEKPLRPDNAGAWTGRDTFDNGATITELRFLIAAEKAIQRQDVRDSILRGLDFILLSELPNGGWPQRFPLPTTYHRHATFNDNVIANIMNLIFDITSNPGDHPYVDADLLAKLQGAFDRGVEFILRSQIRVNGKLTGWCQQHDANTYEPVPGRSFELVSLSGSEGAGIVMLLMRIENPSDRVKEAVEAAVAWFDGVTVRGKRVEIVDDPTLPNRRRHLLVDDPAAPAMWARFYEIGTNRPFFSARDGVKVFDFNQLDQGAMGYRWFGNWGERVLIEYPEWKRRWATPQ